MSSSASASECQWLLRNMGFDRERYNERSALVLLALLGLKPGDPWTESEARLLRTVDIMGWIRDHWEVDYRPNTRETVRRYQVTSEALSLIRSHGTPSFGRNLRRYLAERPGLEAAYRQERDLLKIPVTLPHGAEIILTAGGQNTLLKAMVEEFCPRFTPGGSVLYIGDAGDKWLAFEKEVLESLGVSVDDHGKMPDLVVHMEDRNWLVLLEAASTHGPVDSKRHIELKEIFRACTAGLVFVSCFPRPGDHEEASDRHLVGNRCLDCQSPDPPRPLRRRALLGAV